MSPSRAAGFIIYRTLGQQIEYLLMQTSYGEHHWTPPKGHLEPGESEWDAAVRETKEESGIDANDLEPVRDFSIELRYQAVTKKRGVEDKVVTYYVGKLKDPNKSVQMSNEHQAYRWLSLEPACELSKYDDMKDALRKCDFKLKDLQRKVL